MKTFVLGAVALSVLSGPAFAQRYDRDDSDRYEAPRYERTWRDGDDRRDDRWGDHRWSNDRWRDDRGRWSRERTRDRWSEGGIVPYEYRAGGRYIYYDWHSAGLRRPPRDFAWMLIGSNFLLAHQHTGEIIDVRGARGHRSSYRYDD